MVLTFVSTMAVNRIYIEDFSIEAGETKQVAVLMENDIAFTGFQFDMVLPNGLNIETKSNGDPKVIINTDRADDHQTVTNFRNDGRISILLMSLASTEIMGNSGAVLFFNVTASSDFSGTHQLSIINVEMTTEAGLSVTPDNITCTVEGPANNNPATQIDRLYMEDFSIEVGQTEQVALLMENETPFTGLQFDLVLPEGLTIETKSNGDPKVIINTARADDHQTVTNFRDDGRISVLLMSLNSTEILGSSGAVLYFNLTASNTFNGNHRIDIKNIEMTSADGIAINPTDTFCIVTGVGGDNPPSESMVLNITMAKLRLGKTIQLESNSNDVVWSSSDESVASVDANGLVTAIKDGMVAITATNANGASAWCAVWCYLRGDINEDGFTDISDATTLINYLLSGVWQEDIGQ